MQLERWTLSYRSLRVTLQLIAQGGEVPWSNTSMQGSRRWWTRRQTNGHRKDRNFSIRLEITPICDFCGSDCHCGIGPSYCHKWRCSSRADSQNDAWNEKLAPRVVWAGEWPFYPGNRFPYVNGSQLAWTIFYALWWWGIITTQRELKRPKQRKIWCWKFQI